MYSILGRANYRVISNEDQLLYIRDFVENGELKELRERKIEEGEEGLYTYFAKVSRKDLKALDGDLLLIVPRLRGSWHKVFFNDDLIGVFGTENDYRYHQWNSVQKLLIPNDSFEDDNILKFETYTSYKLGYGDFPIVIGSASIADDVYNALKAIYSNFYLVIIGMLFSLAVMEILLFSLTKTFDRRYVLFPISVLLIGAYLLDYTVLSHNLLSELMFKKMLILALYGSAFITTQALHRLYSSKYLKIYSYFFMTLVTVFVFISSNMVALSYYYNRLNFLLLIMIVMWSVEAFNHYKLSKRSQDYMIGFAGLLLLIPSVYDTIMLVVFEGKFSRLSVYGIVYYSIALLFIAMVNYIDYQKDIYSERRLLESERIRLEKALITDELTGLFNHRHLYDVIPKLLEEHDALTVILFDIDRFRPINDILGHAVGDQILHELGQILEEHMHNKGYVFRYGGEEFIALYFAESPSPEAIAERIRLSVIENKVIHDLSGYLPVTLSVGIVDTECGKLPRVLLNNAEKAVTIAKLNGRNTVSVYDKSMETQLEGYDALELKDQMLVNFIYTLASIIDMKDPYTGKHSEEVSRYAMLIAEEMGLSDEEKSSLRIGGLLHDFGKLGIPDSIITKPDKLTEDEFLIVKKHPIIGYDVVKHFIDDEAVIACVRHHHERYDGSGYPDGLNGEQIPLLSRVICVADAYHAMVSSRSYRTGLGHDFAVKELENNSGSQFDPSIVKALVEVFKK
jgi:diguanylate cyclase (GGDEF)-like protein/putative nucleotidyltransferase with HDIG domain